MNPRFMEQLKNELNMIQLTSKPIIENVEAWQQHGTPDEVVDMMLDTYYENGFKNNERILILFNVEFIKQIYFKYKDELIFGNIYFIADSKEKFDIVSKLYPTVHCLFCIEHTIEKLIEKIGELNVKKFDIVFSNPPYNDNLDLKILKYLFNISKKIVFIHPSTFLMDSRNVEKIYKDLKESGFLQKAILFWANSLFNIKLFCPCAITIWNTEINTDIVEIYDKAFKQWFYNGSEKKYFCKTTEMCMHGFMSKNITLLKEKLNNYIQQNNTLFYKRNLSNELTDFNVVLPKIRGGSDILKTDGNNTCEHFFSFFGYQNENYKQNKTFKFSEKTPDNEKLIFSFKNENERLNFINYCKSKIARFFLSLIKKNGNLHRGELKAIPWLDFTQEWNDAKLCKKFEISEELWNYINNFIPDYYDDYKSGFEK